MDAENVFGMWYSNFRIAGSRRDYLLSMGVAPDVIEFVESSDSTSSGVYTSLLSRNPGMTIPDLQAVPMKASAPQVNPEEQQITSRYDPVFARWVVAEMRRMRNQLQMSGGDPNFPTPYGDLDQIYDWYRTSTRESATDLNGQPRFQISTYNFEQASEMSHHWHEMMAGRGSGKMYEPFSPDRVVYQFGGDHQGWTMQQVTSENDLLAEGNKMNHCVGSYCHYVKEGYSRIYSLRNENNEPIVTVELGKAGEQGGDRVIQMMANSNSEPPEEYRPLLKEWLNTLNTPSWDNSDEIDFDDYDVEDIDDALAEKYEKGDQYGLKSNFKNIDMVSQLYEPILKRFESSSWYGRRGETHYNGDMERAVNPLIGLAFKADKAELMSILAEGKTITPQTWGQISQVEGLRTKCYQHLDKLNDNISDNVSMYGGGNYGEPDEPDPDDYETTEEFDAAYAKWEIEHDQWREEAESEAMDEQYKESIRYLPYGFDDDIVTGIRHVEENDAEFKELLSKAVFTPQPQQIPPQNAEV